MISLKRKKEKILRFIHLSFNYVNGYDLLHAHTTRASLAPQTVKNPPAML